MKHLQGICAEEGIEADKDALHIIAQKADGALRDALSIFDRIVSFSGKKITYDDVITNLNVLDYDYFFKVTDAMMVEDLSSLFLIFDKIQKNGFEADLFINGLAEHFRNVLVCKDEATLQLLEVSDNLKERYKQQAKVAPISFLLSALNIANECDVNYKMARNKRLHVEMALVKMAYINRATTLSQNPVVEKKNPDAPVVVARAKQNTSAPVIAVQKAVEPIQPEAKATVTTPSETALIETTPPAITTPPAPTTEIPVPSPSENKASNPVSPPTGKLGLSISSKYNITSIPKKEDLQSQVNEEIAQTSDAVSLLNQENLEATWKAYYEKVNSPSVKSVFKHAEVTIVDEDSILIKVSSAMGKGMVQQEYELMNFIRTSLKHPKLILGIEVDATKAPVTTKPKPTQLSTPAEKYNKVIEINPKVEELRKRFDLKLDKDN